MNRKFGVSILVFCFALSSVDAASVVQASEAQPVIAGPNDMQDITAQMLEQDRVNRGPGNGVKRHP